MFLCPHCHKSIEIGIGPDGKVPWYRFDPGNPSSVLKKGDRHFAAASIR